MELSIESSCQYVTWNVREFFQLPSEVGYYLNSPEFPFAGDTYCLRLYPNGKKENTVCIKFQLHKLTSNFPEKSVSFKVGYKKKDEKGCKFDIYSRSYLFNSSLVIPRSTLQAYRDRFAPDGTFTGLCSMRPEQQSSPGSQQSEEVKSYDANEGEKGLPAGDVIGHHFNKTFPDSVSCAIQTEEASSLTDRENPKDKNVSFDTKDDALLREGMKNLLTTSKDHDVTICVQDKEFRAHRNILSARSPVFAMMLSHDTKENNTGTITVEDCDPESFDEFLLYVYSGRTENLSPSNALQLYYSADKYNFPVLKERCVSLLKTSLSIKSLCDVVLLAAKHQEKELLKVATEFFARNIKEIIVTVGWQNFLSQYPVEANELYVRSMEILLPEN